MATLDEKVQKNTMLNYFKRRPICVLCNNEISLKDIYIKNYEVSIPKHNFYRIIYVHKSCLKRRKNNEFYK